MLLSTLESAQHDHITNQAIIKELNMLALGSEDMNFPSQYA
jgi:hypothetical protein